MADIVVTGTTDAEVAVSALMLEVDRATAVATSAAAEAVREKIHEKLTAQEHPPGTPTPSRSGDPPAKVSGRLANSVERGNVENRGFGDYAITVGPDAVYARIQELGGDTGRGHLTHLPPRPYVAPAMREALPEIEAIFAERLTDALVL
jgi:phage gpG-like protein